jgi:plastocyanin
MTRIHRSAIAAVLLALGLASVPAYAAGDAAVRNATVSITDSGFNPASVTIVAGGGVTWVNNGSNVHTVSPVLGSNLGFDSGGITPSESFGFTFATPGAYNYSSATDCLNGASIPMFNCSGGVVNVVAAGSVPLATPTSAPAASAAPAGAPAAPSSQSATVSVNDQSFSPASVTIKVGGSVTWTDNGSQVHSASAEPGVGPIAPGVIFDTGGFAPGQSVSLTFQTAGTYAYSSAPDCLNGSSIPQFSCSQSFTVVVAP